MRFFVIDDDPSTRIMLKEIIENEELGEVVGEAENGYLIDGHILDEKQVDIVLIDLLMPALDGLDTISKIVESHYDGMIIMFSQVNSKEMICKAYKLGVEYYIHKPINKLEVVSILNKVIEKAMLKRSLNRIRKDFNHLKEQQYEIGKIKSLLTPTEIKILDLIEQGYSQLEIAELLFISIYTVKSHVRNIISKMKEKSSKKIARKVKELGII
jgi:two-component system response regulator YcbB